MQPMATASLQQLGWQKFSGQNDSAERKASAERKKKHWQRELTRCKQAEGVGQASLEGRDRPLFCIVFDAPRIGGSVVETALLRMYMPDGPGFVFLVHLESHGCLVYLNACFVLVHLDFFGAPD